MKPHVIFNSSMSLDAKIGKKDRDIKLSNKLDHDRVKNLRREVDAILIGAETIKEKKVDLFDFSREIKKPKVVIVDPKLSLDLDEKIFSNPEVIVAISKDIEKTAKVNSLRDKGVETITLGEYTVNLSELLDKLYRHGIRKVLLEDKGNLAKRMLREGFVDEFYLLIAPVLLGEGIDLFSGKLTKWEEVDLELEGIIQYGDFVLLHYLSKR